MLFHILKQGRYVAPLLMLGCLTSEERQLVTPNLLHVSDSLIQWESNDTGLEFVEVHQIEGDSSIELTDTALIEIDHSCHNTDSLDVDSGDISTAILRCMIRERKKELSIKQDVQFYISRFQDTTTIFTTLWRGHPEKVTVRAVYLDGRKSPFSDTVSSK